jgi:hypothetical protein
VDEDIIPSFDVRDPVNLSELGTVANLDLIFSAGDAGEFTLVIPPRQFKGVAEHFVRENQNTLCPVVS